MCLRILSHRQVSITDLPYKYVAKLIILQAKSIQNCTYSDLRQFALKTWLCLCRLQQTESQDGLLTVSLHV